MPSSGPPRPWIDARSSYDRAARTLALRRASRNGDPVDSEQHLADLVLTADPDALADLRAQVLEPLAELSPATQDRLAETLLSWLLHQGRRDEVAAELHVHAQTVRYRMGQVRELYGDRPQRPGRSCATSSSPSPQAASPRGERTEHSGCARRGAVGLPSSAKRCRALRRRSDQDTCSRV